MATIQRPVKTYGTRKYVDEVTVAPGNEDPILASEVDLDLDTIYAAWNGGVDSVNIKSGAVTFVKLAPDAQLWQDTGTALAPGANFTARPIAQTGLPPNGVCFLMGSTAVKGRLRDLGSGGMQILANSVGAATPDDATKASWYLQLNTSNDVFDIYRAAPAASQTFALMSRLDGPGNLLAVGLAGAPRINLGQRCAFEAWDGGICNWYINDSTTPGYSAGLQGWKYTFDYRAGGSAVLSYHAAGAGYGQTMTFDAGGSFSITGAFGNKSTGTVWTNPSDRRLKDEIADYSTGLAAILQLQPRTFVFNGKGGSPAGMRGYGFIADEVAPVMSEMVGVRAGKLDAADEDETDIQTLDQSNLILALVNATKELAARVATLEGAAA